MEATVESNDLKARSADCTLGIPRRFASAERPCPEQGIARALEHVEHTVARANVFPEAELTAGDKYSMKLSKRSGRVGHATEKPHDDGGVEDTVLCRQSNGIAVHDFDRDPRRVGALCSGRPGRGIRLDGQQAFDFRRVVLERAPITRADLDDPAAQPAEQAPPQLARDKVGAALLAAFQVPGKTRLPGPVERCRLSRVRWLPPFGDGSLYSGSSTIALPPPRRCGSAAASTRPPPRNSMPVAAPISAVVENP